MKKLFLLLLLFVPFVNAQNPFVSTGSAWYTSAGIAITALGSTDTAYTTAVDYFPYDSVYISINPLQGDTLGFVLKFQTGHQSSNGTVWSALRNLTAAGAADTVGFTSAATTAPGKSFTYSIPAGDRSKAQKLRFAVIGSEISGRLNGTTAEKWLTNKQTYIFQLLKR